MCRVEERRVVGAGCKEEMIDVVGNWGEKKDEGLGREEKWGWGLRREKWWSGGLIDERWQWVRWSILKYFMFVYLGFIVQLDNFSLIWRNNHNWWKAAHFDLCSGHMIIEHGGFFNLPHLMWHGASVYNGHLCRHVTLKPIAERLVVEINVTNVTTWFYYLGLSRLRFERQTLLLLDHCSNPLRHGRGCCNVVIGESNTCYNLVICQSNLVICQSNTCYY